jgi:hypothetical protein
MSDRLLEKETIINFNEFEEKASIYTASETLAKKLKKNPQYKLIEIKGRSSNNTKGYFFECDKSFLKKVILHKKRQVTNKQKKLAGERLKMYHFSKQDTTR